MAFDTFLDAGDIKGESTDDKHKDWMEVLSFSFGVHQPASATASSAGGGSAERCDHDDFVITKFVDKASPKLFEACCKGQHLKKITVEMCRAGGDKLPYMKIEMEQVIISSVVPAGSAKGEHGFPIETVSINYGTIKQTYTQQKRADGSGGGNVTGGWDRTANKVAA